MMRSPFSPPKRQHSAVLTSSADSPGLQHSSGGAVQPQVMHLLAFTCWHCGTRDQTVTLTAAEDSKNNVCSSIAVKSGCTGPHLSPRHNRNAPHACTLCSLGHAKQKHPQNVQGSTATLKPSNLKSPTHWANHVNCNK